MGGSERGRVGSRAGRMAGTSRRNVLQPDLRRCPRVVCSVSRRRPGRGQVPVSDAFSLPIVLDGRSISALVVGGGRVALRKVRALLAGGARVRVVAKEIRPELEQLEAGESRLLIRRGSYE